MLLFLQTAVKYVVRMQAWVRGFVERKRQRRRMRSLRLKVREPCCGWHGNHPLLWNELTAACLSECARHHGGHCSGRRWCTKP